VSAQPTPPPLQLSGMWKRYPGVDALKNVSFAVEAGEIHALLGENGAGKTTLVGVASGSIVPDEGVISIRGAIVPKMTPLAARRLGVAIVHQEPALLPDLTVLENMVLGVPRQFRAADGRSDAKWARRELDRVGCSVDLGSRIEDVGVANRQLIELAKAFAADPAVLILDEPTAPLGAERVERLFQLVREAAARGAAIVYISHRLPEVRAIANRVTVMRDGAVRGTFGMGDVTDQDLVELIVGRALETVFPPKSEAGPDAPVLEVSRASGRGFENVELAVRPGEIVGLAGIAGNGQTEFLRSMAGLVQASGEVRLAGNLVHFAGPAGARAAGISYVSADRHNEGVFKTMSVRENTALSALEKFERGRLLNRGAEVQAVERLRTQLAIRTPSIETAVGNLSGGNQQKVVMARSMLAEPALLLVDEPTQGVDAGARVEIYAILRRIAASGVPVVVLSSDGLELEGLCDRVYVFSRGLVVAELKGLEVTERQIARRMVMATTHRRADNKDAAAPAGASAVKRRLRRFARNDWFPSAILLVVMLVLGVYTYSVSPKVLSPFNIGSALTLLAALAFMSLGQTTAIMTGGIDISVGPLAGVLVCIASYFVIQGSSGPLILAGLALMLVVAIAVGSVNGTLVRFGRFTPVAATLTTYIALQGVALLLRPVPGGSILQSVAEMIQTKIGPIPISFLVAVIVAIGAEVVLLRSRAGLALRAVGSSEKAAHRVGVPVSRTFVLAYVVSAIFVFLGSVLLMAQVSIGDPVAGIQYTLWSVTAVVLGGTSLFGGRGSYIGSLLGAALIQQILNATVFLGLSQAWQYWFLGLLTLIAAGVYSQARRVRENA
jgi:ribose transport system ATP-binding protein